MQNNLKELQTKILEIVDYFDEITLTNYIFIFIHKPLISTNE
jgi:hypothetical protein